MLRLIVFSATMTQRAMPTRVLVVDDDAMSRELLGALLDAEGYAVESADSGDAALALLHGGGPAPDLVLADAQMPGTTGSRLAGKLRQACGPGTMLLAMSGSRPPENMIASFDGFLLKPFKMEEIAALLSARSGQVAGKMLPGKGEKRAGAPGRPQPSAKPASKPAPAPHTASKRGMDSPVQSAEPAAGTPVLNEKIYGQIAASMPAQQLQEMYAMCVNDTRARIASMRRLAEARDAAKFVREAHSIKGGCGMLGASELHGMAAELEKNGFEGAEQAVNSLDELAAACDRLERILGSRV